MSYSPVLGEIRLPSVAVCVGIVMLALAGPTRALADDDDYERGPKVKVDDDGKEYKYEYEDRRCKYKYELKYRTGEEKIEEKGDCRGVAPQRAVYYSSERDWSYEDGSVRDDDRERQDSATPRSDTRRRLACNREVIGQVLGGVAGGVLGSRVGDGSGRRAATIAGSIVGVMIGGTLGRRMDRSDAACAYQALEFAEADQTVFWRNPASDIEYHVTPDRRTRRADGRYCRSYRALATGVGADGHDTAGTACRRSDGSWELESR